MSVPEDDRNDFEAVDEILRNARPTTYGEPPFAMFEAKLRESFPDLVPFELQFALHQGAPLQKLTPGWGIDAGARVAVLREAERRISLPRPAFHEIVKDLLPGLLAVNLDDAGAIEAAVQAKIDAMVATVGPALAAKRRAQTSEARHAVQVRKNHWADRATQLRDQGFSITRIARKLSGERGMPTSERTVSRWLGARKQ